MPKRLIINADDFGWTRGITDGIVECPLHGVVTSTSLMVAQRASEYALEQVSKIPSMSVGIHINLCEGRPVLSPREVPTLVRADGSFYPFPEMARKLWRFQVSARELEAEIRAQVRWMKERGVIPTHADSHQHLHNYPAAAGPYRKVVVCERIKRSRAPKHRYWPKDGLLSSPHAGSALRKLAATTYMEILQALAFGGVECPDSCIVFHPRFRGKLDELGEAWVNAFDNMPQGSYEMGCHPGFFTDGFSQTDPISEKREREVLVFTDPALRDCITRNQIELITYRELGNPDVARHRTATVAA
jgi:chitin disaccharide deacetylase